ncbi:MAG: phosphate ABC transporter substrate-binding protein PstS family protein [Candidatus Omnitrophica bacterium]|nr:phosphate ABC transporter substrate-binding protein PstS family protein [Candidatus Omnitrophota bacterium]
MKKSRKIIALAVMAVFLCTSGGARAGDMVQIKGSDTLINLVQKLSEVYMEKNPGKYIAVTGGGSGTGIAALTNGKCDLANASRNMKPKEITRAQSRGVSPKRVVIALDGLSVIVNGTNGVDKLTMGQIGKIFRGEATNWKDVGGADKPITLYGRQSNSGTFVLFRDMVLKGDYSARMKRMNGNSQIVEAVKADSTGIGYVGVGYVKNVTGIKVLEVAAYEGAPYASPLRTEDVKSGKYPIARPLNQYVDGTPEGDVRDFIEFELSAEGQRIVEEEGFFPIPKEYEQFNERNAGI